MAEFDGSINDASNGNFIPPMFNFMPRLKLSLPTERFHKKANQGRLKPALHPIWLQGQCGLEI